VTIRDGRTSQENIRKPKFDFSRTGDQIEETHDEFIVVDSVGRLQIPRNLVERLKFGRRARVLMEEDHLAVWPVDGQEGDKE
ncbi:MAG TPA: ABC transporter ATP-binding protein, partial [Dehalococcoidia bacterium]|nr:ABC transporter ATP-binding protein [Dehalococcoidia bacterium]